MKKQIIAALCMLMVAVPVYAEAPEYTYDAETHLLDSYSGQGGDLVIPDTFEGNVVEGLDISILYGMSGITSVTLPETAEELGASNFYEMPDVTSVTLPESLEVIGTYNFYGCPQLTEVTVPGKVSFIGKKSFVSCENLKTIRFNGELPVIETGCFAKLPEDCVIYVPEDQLQAYQEALPSGLNIQSTGENAVVYEHVTPEEEFEFDAATGTLISYLGDARRVDIPETIGGTPVTAIGEEALYNETIYYVTMPDTVTMIGESAFHYNLFYVKLSESLETLGNFALYGYRGTSLDLPESLTSIGEGAFGGMSPVSIELPEGLTEIPKRAFESASVQDVYIPSTVEKIAEEAFAGSSVSYLCLAGKELPEIAETAFQDTEVADVDLNWQASKEQMIAAQEVFDSMGQVTRVWRMQNPNADYVRDGLDSYENGVMLGYTGEQTHISPWYSYDDIRVTALGDGAFKGNTVIEYFAVPYSDEFTTIGAEAFADSSVQFVDLFDSVTTIGAGAFRNCVNMTELTLPESVTSVGEGILEGCTGLKKVTVLCDPSILPADLFGGCTALEEVWMNAEGTEEQAQILGEMTGQRVLPVGMTRPEPVGEEGVPFVGVWNGSTMEAEGMEMELSDLGMELSITFYEDGFVDFAENGVPETATWKVTDGAADIIDMMQLKLDDYGRLCMDEEGTIIYFLKEGVEYQIPEEAETEDYAEEIVGLTPVGEEGAAFFGVWNGTVMETESFEMSMADLGMTMNLTFYENGLVEMYDGESTDEAAWSVVDGAANIDGMMLTIGEDGTLCMDAGDGTFMYFAQGEASEVSGTPETEAAEAPSAVDAEFAGTWTSETGTLELNTDGTCVLTWPDGSTAEMTWEETEGGATITSGNWWGCEMVLKDVNTLSIDGDWVVMNREGGAAVEAAPETEAPSAGDAEFAGTWTSDTGTLELNADGTCVLTWLDGSTAEMTWEETEGGATITSGNWWGCEMVLKDVNTLSIDGDWVVMNREGGAAVEAAPETEAPSAGDTGATALTGTTADYVGTWHCAYLSAGPMEGDPRTLFGLNILLVLNEDGTGTIDYPEPEEGIWYEGEYNYMYFGQGGDNADMPMKLLDGGFLQYGTELAGYLVFSQDENAVWTPDMLAAETEAAAPVQIPEPSMPEAPAGTAVAAGAMEERLDKKFVAVNADVGGFIMEASMLGGEFSVTFNSDGSLKLIMVGAEAPGLTWTQGTVETENGEADAFIVNYYNTNTLEFVATEAGFDLNYFDSMLLHFVPEA